MAHPLYIFSHQYKTGGKTLLANLALNIPPSATVELYVGPAGLDLSKRRGNVANPGWARKPLDDLVRKKANAKTRLLVGHFAYPGVHELVPTNGEVRYITFLRHPVERVVSLYNYLKFNSDNYWHEELLAANWSLEEWLEASGALWAHNGQVRHLLFATYERECQDRELSPALLEEAKRRLSQYWFVGLTESFRKDSFYLYGKMRFHKFITEEVVNATRRKEPVSSKTYQAIEAKNRLDLELYDFALELRRRFFAQQWLNYQWNIKRAQVRRHKFHRSLRDQDHPSKPRSSEKEMA